MNLLYALKIDAYSHITPLKYMQALEKVMPEDCHKKIAPTPPLYDLNERFRIMDKFEGLVQVLTLSWPAIEEIGDPAKAVDLARLANDELAELVFHYPDRFVAGIACLPMNDLDAAWKEIDRAVNDLKRRGVLVYSNIQGKPLDCPEFWPLYEKMSQYDLPIYIHPQRSADFPDYKTETASRYNAYSVFGWPYETTVAMTRLVFSGILEKYPRLKVVTHHGGGMVPYFEQRIVQHHDKYEMGLRREGGYKRGLTRSPIDYFKLFYNDTAIHGNAPALMCEYAFSGGDPMLFAADMPLGDREFGCRSYRQTLNAIHAMSIGDAEKKRILEDNARALMRLPI